MAGIRTIVFSLTPMALTFLLIEAVIVYASVKIAFVLGVGAARMVCGLTVNEKARWASNRFEPRRDLGAI
jgi:hypothetical protein